MVESTVSLNASESAFKERLLNITLSRLVWLALSEASGSGANRSFNSSEPSPDSPTPPPSSLVSVLTKPMARTARTITKTVASKMIQRWTALQWAIRAVNDNPVIALLMLTQSPK